MSEFEKLKIVTRYELLKQFRRKRFYGVLAITLLAVVLTIGLYQGLDLPRRMGVPESIINQHGVELFAIFVTSMGSMAILPAARNPAVMSDVLSHDLYSTSQPNVDAV